MMLDDKKIVNLDNATKSRRAYTRSAQSKESLIIDGDFFIFKKSPRISKRTHNFQVESYLNSEISEYIGCRIFQSVGIDAQQTFIAVRNGNTGTLCKDFVDRSSGYELQEFGQLANEYYSSGELGRIVSLEQVYYTYENHSISILPFSFEFHNDRSS